MNKLLLVAVLATIVMMTSGCFRVINDGQVGVRKTLGNYNDEELGTGVSWFIPFFQTVYKDNVKLKTMNAKVSVPTEEGLIVELDVSVIYRIKADQASEIRQEVTGNIDETLLVPYMRNGIRDVVAGYKADAVYKQEGRVEIADKLMVFMAEKLDNRLFIDDVILRDVLLPQKVRTAIEDKLDAEQKGQQKEFELVAAKKDAEIDIARAEGIAASNEIISGTITEEYLRWKFIESLAIAEASVIYIPTEGSIPILEAARFSSVGAGAMNVVTKPKLIEDGYAPNNIEE